MTIPTNAKENKLYFNGDEDKLYYTSDIDKKFMVHEDMIPGKEYTDELILENGTNTKYKLYFKIEDKNDSSNLLEYIDMTITLDGKEIFNGNCLGNDYSNKNYTLTNSVLLGTINPNENHKMIVKTTLSENYPDEVTADSSNNTTVKNYSYTGNSTTSSIINWKFLASDGEKLPVQIVKTENTAKNSLPYITIFAVTLIILGTSIIIYAKRS
jgi:hypothetical protein